MTQPNTKNQHARLLSPNQYKHISDYLANGYVSYVRNEKGAMNPSKTNKDLEKKTMELKNRFDEFFEDLDLLSKYNAVFTGESGDRSLLFRFILTGINSLSMNEQSILINEFKQIDVVSDEMLDKLDERGLKVQHCIFVSKENKTKSGYKDIFQAPIGVEGEMIELQYDEDIEAYIMKRPKSPPEPQLTGKQQKTLNFIGATSPKKTAKGTIEVSMNFHPSEATRILKQLIEKRLITEHIEHGFDKNRRKNIVFKSYSLTNDPLLKGGIELVEPVLQYALR